MRRIWLILYVPVNNYSVMSGCAFLGWTSTKQRIKCLAQEHNTVPSVRLQPTTPQSSHALYHWATAHKVQVGMGIQRRFIYQYVHRYSLLWSVLVFCMKKCWTLGYPERPSKTLIRLCGYAGWSVSDWCTCQLVLVVGQQLHYKTAITVKLLINWVPLEVDLTLNNSSKIYLLKGFFGMGQGAHWTWNWEYYWHKLKIGIFYISVTIYNPKIDLSPWSVTLYHCMWSVIIRKCRNGKRDSTISK